MEEKKIVRDENNLLQVVDKEVDSNLAKNRPTSLFDDFFCDGLSDSMVSVYMPFFLNCVLYCVKKLRMHLVRNVCNKMHLIIHPTLSQYSIIVS